MLSSTKFGTWVKPRVEAASALRNGGRMAAASRQMATIIQTLRWEAVSSGRGHAMLFQHDGLGWFWLLVRDGNGNGLRRVEIDAGTDVVLSGPHRLEARVPPVRLGFPPGGPYPEIPPRRGWLDTSGPAVRFGHSDMVAFGPLGTGSSGTLYLTDGRETLSAIVLYGPTARVRVWRYDRNRGAWVH